MKNLPLNLLPPPFASSPHPLHLTLLPYNRVYHRPLSLLFLCNLPLLRLNTDYFYQGHAPLHLYIISPFLPRPAQSSPLTFHSPPEERFKHDYPSSPLAFSPLSKQSYLLSAQRRLGDLYHHTGDHNKIIYCMRDTEML